MPSILMRGEWSLEKALDLYSGSTEPDATAGASPDNEGGTAEEPVVSTFVVTTATIEPPPMPSILTRGEWILEKALELYSRVSASSTEPEVTTIASPDDEGGPAEEPVVSVRNNDCSSGA